MNSILRAYREGKPSAAEQLVKDHLGLVRSVVGRLAVQLPPGVDREDLEEVGIIGLLSAAHSFDESRGAAFSTYAYMAVRAAVLDELRRLDVLPRTRRNSLRAYENSLAELRKTLGRQPTFLEIQSELNLSAPELEEVLRARALSDAAAGGMGESTTGIDPASFVSRCEDDPAVLAQFNEAKERLAEAIGTLPAREQEIVLLYFRGGLLLREIGLVLEITESRVSQILQNALVMLNHRLRDLNRDELDD